MESKAMLAPASNSASELLRQALERAHSRNPRVSVSSIARRLGVSASYLSKIFRGEKPLTKKLLRPLGRALRLDALHLAELQRLTLEKFAANNLGLEGDLRALAGPLCEPLVGNYAPYGPGDSWLLSSWYYLPLLNLLGTRDFRDDPAWIAERLGLSVRETTEALTRLLESGYLYRKDNSLKRRDERLRFPVSQTTELVRSFHRQFIARADQALAATPSEEDFLRRQVSSLSFTADSRRIEAAKLILEEAIYRAANLLSEGEGDEVYQLNLQLFPLTKKR